MGNKIIWNDLRADIDTILNSYGIRNFLIECDIEPKDLGNDLMNKIRTHYYEV